jgi:hypothetical protein
MAKDITYEIKSMTHCGQKSTFSEAKITLTNKIFIVITMSKLVIDKNIFSCFPHP